MAYVKLVLLILFLNITITPNLKLKSILDPLDVLELTTLRQWLYWSLPEVE